MRTTQILLAASMILGCGRENRGTPTPDPASTSTSSDTSNSAAGVEALRAADQRMGEAWRAHDAAILDALYTENAVLVNPGEEPLEGRASIDALHREEMSRAGYLVEGEPIRVEAAESGELGYVYGRWSARSTDASEPEAWGYYVNVYRKIDGTWRTVVEVNGSSTPDTP